MTDQANQGVLRFIIPVLALADGVLHLSLDWVLFRGRLIGGRPSLFVLPLNELFILNFVGEVALVLLFLFASRSLGSRQWIINVAMILFAAATFVGWWMVGRPNPMGLGYLSKAVELLLIVALIVDLRIVLRPAGLAGRHVTAQ